MTFADDQGATFVHPFDHPHIIAGQGTCGLEILEQMPDVNTIVVPTGGGGLISGIATAAKSLKDDVRIVSVQAEGAAAFPVPCPGASSHYRGPVHDCGTESPATPPGNAPSLTFRLSSMKS